MQAWPGNVKACFRAGMALLRLGQPGAASASFSVGLQFVPGHRCVPCLLSFSGCLTQGMKSRRQRRTLLPTSTFLLLG